MSSPTGDIGTVTILRDATSSAVGTATVSSGPQMTLLTESGTIALAVDVAPRDIEYSNLENNWASADRSGTVPLLLFESVPLMTMQFSFMLTSKRELHVDQTSKIDSLRRLARTSERVLCRYGPSEQGTWRVTSCSMSSVLREPNTNAITRANVSITLTQSSDASPAIGPILKPPPPPPSNVKKPPPRTYVVRRCDTLWSIARKFYGDNSGPQWPRIYDANRKVIKDPHKLKSGTKLVIP